MFALKASNSCFCTEISCILWLHPDPKSKRDNWCLTLLPLRGLHVTVVGGICWYTIRNFNTVEYFLSDIIPRHLKVISQREQNQMIRLKTLQSLPVFVCCARILSGRMNRGNLVYFLCRPQALWRMARCEDPVNRLMVAWVFARVKHSQIYATLIVVVM